MASNHKWLYGTALGMTLVGSLYPFNVKAQAAIDTYSDMQSASSWAVDSIRFLNDKGITQGYGNQSYLPHRPISRQEVAVLLARALNLQAGDSKDTIPSDLNPNSWAYDGIRSVLAQGLMGDASQPFRPYEPVTRQELIAIIAQATGAQGSGASALPEQDDRQLDPANRRQVADAVELGLLRGDGSTLELNKPTERQEVAVVLRRLLNAMNAPAEKEAVVTVVGTDKIRLGAFVYPMTEELKNLLGPANAGLLDGTTLKVRLTDGYRVEQIVDMTIPATKRDLVLDGKGIHVSGNLTILGDKLTLKNMNVDGALIVGGNGTPELAVENSKIAKLRLASSARLTLGGDTAVASLVVPEAAVENTRIVIRDKGKIDDIVVPDKRLVPALVQDYGSNQGKVRLINGQPPESAPASVPSAPATMLYAIPVNKIQPVAEAYTLPTQVSVRMSDGSSVPKNVVWQAPEGVDIADGQVLLSTLGVYAFTGTVEGFSEQATLNVDVRLSLKLTQDSVSETVEADAGQKATFTFDAEPVTEVSSTVPNVAYMLQWFDEDGVNRTLEVDLRSADGFFMDRWGDAWIVSYSGSHAVASRETISLEAVFGAGGTYAMKVTAIKYNPVP